MVKGEEARLEPDASCVGTSLCRGDSHRETELRCLTSSRYARWSRPSHLSSALNGITVPAGWGWGCGGPLQDRRIDSRDSFVSSIFSRTDADVCALSALLTNL